ncbi:MAG: site-2 protease family protein, partial [Candidatus Micrarchaeia archaeon]
MDKKFISEIAIIVGFALLVFAAYSSWLGTAMQAFIAIAAMVIVGIIVRNEMKLHGGYGFYMIGGKKGIHTIDSISKSHPKFWSCMATWGLSMGLGVFTYFLTKGRVDKRAYILGVISAVLLFVYVIPYTSLGLSFISVAQLQNEIAARSVQQPNYLVSYILLAIIALAGFSGYVIGVIIYSAGLILDKVILIIESASQGAATTAGLQNLISALPIIPGIDLPLIAGLLSLAFLLIIHEFSHGILARTFKVKLKSIGLLLFGVIPVGAFVEPEEKMVKKLSPEKQTLIFSAGISANFIATVVFFALLVLVIVIMQHVISYNVVVTATMPGYPASNVIVPGTIIYKWDGHVVDNISTLESAASEDKPGSIVSLVTNKGTYSFNAIAGPTNSSRGLIGMSLALKPTTSTPITKTIYFLYMLFDLSMLLN